jgi:hypothetical protein
LLPSPLDDVVLLLELDEVSLVGALEEPESLVELVGSFADVESVEAGFEDDFAPERLSVL